MCKRRVRKFIRARKHTEKRKRNGNETRTASRVRRRNTTDRAGRADENRSSRENARRNEMDARNIFIIFYAARPSVFEALRQITEYGKIRLHADCIISICIQETDMKRYRPGSIIFPYQKNKYSFRMVIFTESHLHYI